MFAASKTSTASSGYQISRSLRFNQPDSTYLNRAFSTNGTSQRICTISLWAKLGSVSTSQYRLVDCYNGSSGTSSNIRVTNNQLILAFGGGSTAELTTSAVYRDPSAWYHIVASIDSTQATSSDRMKLYVNGVQVTTFASSTYPTQNATYNFMFNVGANVIGGAWDGTSSQYLNGYMTEINYIDGTQLTPSSFGETNAQTGVWQPKAYSGSYGTNGFYLNFSDNSNTTAATLGKDYSGNGNNWTPNNFSVTAGAGNDSMVDVPTPYGVDTGAGGEVRGNYCTFNPLFTGGTLANGNLDFSAASGVKTSLSTIALPTSGKWYWEVTVTAVGNSFQVGIGGALSSGTNYLGSSSDAYAYSANAVKYNNASSTAYGASYTTNDVIAVAYDADAGTLVFYKNNTSQGTAFSSLSGTFFPAVSYGSSSGSGSCTINMGQRPFSYTAPSGFKALCTQNLPTPTIGGTSATLANKYFDINLWTGNGTSQTLTNSGGFQPDWVWLKSRSSGTNFHNLYDVLRGATKYLFSNSTSAEGTNAQALTAFTSTGFSVGNDNDVNQSSGTYVGWQWKANGTGSTNTSGSITSTVSANTTSGFSVVTYTNASSGTVGHGLGVAPAMVIYKDRTNVTNWVVLHQSLTNMSNYYLKLNLTDAVATGITLGGNPTSSVIYTNTNIIQNGAASVAYCFAEVAGYSKFDSYTGNGSTDGPFVFTGFRPAFILIKGSSDADRAWVMLDVKRNTYNAMNVNLYANASDAEATDTRADANSNGFKLRGTGTWINNSGSTYIYMAFAENPFKYSLAR